MGILGYQLNAQTVTIGALTLGLGLTMLFIMPIDMRKNV